MNYYLRSLFMLCGALGASVAAPVAHAAVVTDFSTGFEGWTSSDSTGLSWQSAGGNPGGFVGFTDLGPADGGQLIAPAAYLGDWSAADGVGSLSLDMILFDLGTGVPFTTPTVIISGPGGSASWSGPVPTGTFGWTNFVASVSVGSWSVSSGAWLALLANVTELRVNISAATSTASPGEVTGVDNIILQVPTPSGAAVLAIGGLTIARSRRRG